MECSKCGKKLAFYGSSDICHCKKCKQYFCGEEGHILDNNKLVEVAKRTNFQIIYDFLCFDCETNEIEKEKAEKEQNEKRVTAREERERAEMLKVQRLHGGDK